MPGPTRVQPRARSKVPFPFVAGFLLAAVIAVMTLRQASGPSGHVGAASTGPSGSPNSGTSATPTQQLHPLPSCEYASVPAIRTRYRDWRYTLLDTTFRLAKTYAPPGLVSTARAGLEGGYLVRKIVIKDLAALREAAEAAGNPIGVVAAYRSFQTQTELFDKRRAQEGYDAAVVKTARPGHSEHQLGTTLDFKTKGAPDVNKDWSRTPTGSWVTANAWRFGFVLSYPRLARGLTCYGYEPWHFRYVGRTVAAQVHDSRLTLREFLWRWNQEHPA
jgi:D-alanyl-D-alanine carboxypeptidase